MPTSAVRLLKRTICPHCWSGFAPEEVLWVSAHNELLGDPRLGPEQHQRFLPTRFTVEGNAVDARGFPCNQLACPKCHLVIPRGVVEMEPLFISILGTPACGKSYFLTGMTWELRRLLPQFFGLEFTDADLVTNRNLIEYEENLFLNARGDELVPMANLIRKTETQGELYDTVLYGDQPVSYPRPFMFCIRPKPDHPNFGRTIDVARLLCLYDNAGEHFLAGQDSTSSPVTRHLAQSRLLLFLFDPTQDLRFRKLCQDRQLSSPTLAAGRTSRQEAVLHEAAARVRRFTGLAQNALHQRPLIVVVTKYDAWAHLLDKDAKLADPWRVGAQLSAIDPEPVEKRSQSLRSLLLRVCPEVVGAAESFARSVTYLPVSALGQEPQVDPQSGALAVRPGQIKPIWAGVPLIYGLARHVPGLVPTVKKKTPTPGTPGPSGAVPFNARVVG